MLLVACSSGKVVPPQQDNGPSRHDGAADREPATPDGPPADGDPDGPARDAAGDGAPRDAAADGAHDAGPDGPRPDVRAPDAGCTLGTADDCASCGDRCPGPASGMTTERICAAARCDIRCKGEFYDVNGDVADGCEAADDTPIHADEATAATIGVGAVGDCDPIQTTAAVLPSDGRKHAQPPSDRPQGRPDFFKLEIKDAGCTINATVKVLLTSMPASATYELSSIYECKDGTRMTSTSRTVSGGTSTVLDPSTSCTLWGMGDDSGTLMIYVRKLSGPHSADTYEIEVEP